MKAKNRKIEALRTLREDAPMVSVRYAVKELMGFQLKDMAPIIGTRYTEISNVLSGRRRNPRVREAVARFWRLPVEELWPDEETE